jgi:hypothetical protein
MSSPPAIGAHTLQVLRAQGLKESEIEQLQAGRVIAVAD